MNIRETIFEKVKTGVLLITFCKECRKFIWPPSQHCNVCFKETVLKKIDNDGILLEKTYSNLPFQKNYFGIGEFSNIRLIGKVNEGLEIRERIKISKMDIKDNRLDIEFEKF